jgi:hypothetical protein
MPIIILILLVVFWAPILAFIVGFFKAIFFILLAMVGVITNFF